jgi:hypothetical protein
MPKHRHPKGDELYTPTTPQLLYLFERMRNEYGTSREICALSGLRLKVFRRIRKGQHKAVSMRTLDKLITATGIGSLDDFLWFTADDLVALGIWLPSQYVAGKHRYRVMTIRFPKEKDGP